MDLYITMTEPRNCYSNQLMTRAIISSAKIWTISTLKSKISKINFWTKKKLKKTIILIILNILIHFGDFSGQIITTGGVTYKNDPWHRECFTCTHCDKSLAGQRFTSKDEKPYCAECFGELFAKRCTACTKPITGKTKNLSSIKTNQINPNFQPILSLKNQSFDTFFTLEPKFWILNIWKPLHPNFDLKNQHFESFLLS